MQNFGSTNKSALGLDGNVTALIGYLIGIVALVLIFIEKDNKFVRFHAFQSVLWSVVSIVLIFATGIIGGILALIFGQVSSALGGIVGLLTFLVYLVLLFAMVGGLIYGAIKAYGGSEYKLPFVGNLAEKYK